MRDVFYLDEAMRDVFYLDEVLDMDKVNLKK